MSDDRLIDLETKLAFQEDTVAKLNSVVVAQRTQLDNLERAFQELQRRVAALQHEATSALDQELPPHY